MLERSEVCLTIPVATSSPETVPDLPKDCAHHAGKTVQRSKSHLADRSVSETDSKCDRKIQVRVCNARVTAAIRRRRKLHLLKKRHGSLQTICWVWSLICEVLFLNRLNGWIQSVFAKPKLSSRKLGTKKKSTRDFAWKKHHQGDPRFISGRFDLRSSSQLSF